MLFFPLKGFKMHARNACFNAFSTFCVHLCGFEIQHHHLIWRYFSVKRHVMLQKMESQMPFFTMNWNICDTVL